MADRIQAVGGIKVLADSNIHQNRFPQHKGISVPTNQSV